MFNIRDAILKRLLLSSVKRQCKSGLTSIHHAISLFNQMTSLDPFPSAVDFNHLFTAIAKMKPQKHHAVIVTLSKELELLGLRPNMHSLGILTDCYCRLGRVDFGFALLGKRIKLGYEPDIVIFTTLINGLIDANNDIDQAVRLLDKIVRLGIQPNVVTYGAIVKGFCKTGNNAGAIRLLRRMQSDGVCKPDVVIYTMIIGSLCKENLLSQAFKLLDEMQKDGISPNAVTFSALVQGCCDWERSNDVEITLIDVHCNVQEWKKHWRGLHCILGNAFYQDVLCGYAQLYEAVLIRIVGVVEHNKAVSCIAARVPVNIINGWQWSWSCIVSRFTKQC